MDSNPKNSWIDLYQKNPEKTWTTFVQKHTRLILAVIHKQVHDYDEAMEVYTYVLDKLKEKNCTKLNDYYEKSRNYNFEIWIAVVVRNCCIDWIRQQKGRKHLLKCIEELPPLDQCIFHYIYQCRYSYDSVFELLNNKHGIKISFEEMCSHIDQLDDKLQQKQNTNLHTIG